MTHNIATQVGHIKWSKWATPDEQTRQAMNGTKRRVRRSNLLFRTRLLLNELVREDDQSCARNRHLDREDSIGPLNRLRRGRPLDRAVS